MPPSKQTAKPELVPALGKTTGAALSRQIAQTRLRTIVHVADGHATAADLARRVGVSQPHMANILTGRRNLTPEIADRLNSAIDRHERATARPFGGIAA